MTTYRDRRYIEARRAYRNALRTHGDELLDEILFRQADRSIDCGEWSDAMQPEPTFYNASGEVQERLLVAVADAYSVGPCRLDDCIRQLDEDESRIVSPPCPFHERGLDCRSSAPRGIDDDGEPFGDRGCGCDPLILRQRLVRRLQH